MEPAKATLQNLLKTSPSPNRIFQRNVIKEYLQVLALDFIYSDKKYSGLVFYGGSSLVHCHGLQRLSEDLGFVDLKKTILLPELAAALEKYFKDKTDLNAKTSLRKFRITLKFPLLRELGLADRSESDFVNLRVEVFRKFSYCKFKTEMIPLFKMNKSILVRTFDLPTLMATKINAVLHRKWEKTDKRGGVLQKVKGRDYFDLMWYLQKEIKPNLDCVGGVDNLVMLKNGLLKSLGRADSRSIRLDLESLIEDQGFVKKLSRNIKEIIARDLNKW